MASHRELGQFNFERGQYHQAIEQFRAHLVDDPHCVVSHAMIAASHVNLKQTKQAAGAVRAALSLDPEYAFAHYIRSFVHLQRLQLARADRAIREALRIETTSDFLHQAARIAMVRGSHADALELVDDALALNPQDAATLVLRGRILACLGRLKDAHDVFLAALAENPESSEAHQALGELNLRERESTAALDLLREARRLDPIDAKSDDAIAAAHGQAIWPLKLLTPLVFDWIRASVARRSSVFLALGTTLVTGGLLVSKLAAQFPEAMTAWRGFCITVASIVALPLCFSFAAQAVGGIALRREFGYGRIDLIRRTVLFLLFVGVQVAAVVVGWNIADPWRAAAFCLGCALTPNLLQTIRSPHLRLQGAIISMGLTAKLVWSRHGAFQFDVFGDWTRPAGVAIVIAIVYVGDILLRCTIGRRRVSSPAVRRTAS